MVSAMNLHPLTPEQKNEYTRIAYYYYEAGQTQDQIAQRLGISRQRVNRILAECIERGIVRITVDRRTTSGRTSCMGIWALWPDSISSPSSSGEISSAAFPAAAWPGWWPPIIWTPAWARPWCFAPPAAMALPCPCGEGFSKITS